VATDDWDTAEDRLAALSDRATATRIVAALSEVAAGPFRALHEQVVHPDGVSGLSLEVFPGSNMDDGGAAVLVYHRRSDGYIASWMVEVWLYSDRPSGSLTLIVKAEIDLESRDDYGTCVLDQQEIVTESPEVRAAIGRAAELVLGFPLANLLTDGWTPPEWATEED
jgi:hypothetical protein